MLPAARGGFTLIETLMVMGVFLMVSGFGLYVSMESYRGSLYHSDRDLVVMLLERARAQAINNLCYGSDCEDGKSHGVHIQSDKYILFQGDAYDAGDPLNASFDADNNTQHSFTGDIIFSQLSGTTSAPATITLSGEGRTSEITVSPVGQITWTN